MKAKSIYHICSEAAWAEAQEAGVYAADSLASEGFIHCSTAEQLPDVAERLFAGQMNMIALVIDPARLRAEVRYENTDGGEELFPHIYGSIPLAAVTRITKLAVSPADFTKVGY